MGDRFSDKRREAYQRLKTQFPSSPIRLVSKMDGELRQDPEYTGITVAVGDLDERGFPPRFREAIGSLKRPGDDLVEAVGRAEGVSLERYNLTGTGYGRLREAWAALVAQESGIQYDPAAGACQVFVTHGGMQAVFNSLIATSAALGWGSRVRPGQRPSLYVPTPFFPCVGTQCKLLGIDIRPHDCAPEDGFLPSAARIRDERVLADTYYLMSTGNPTSVAMPGDTPDPTSVRAVIEAILDVNPEAAIVLDIVYNRTLAGARNRDMLGFLDAHPAKDRILLIESLSKTHAFTGTRAGVVLTSHPTVSANLRDLGLDSMAGPSNVMQWRAANVLRPHWDPDATDGDRAASRDLVQGLAAHMGRRRAALLKWMFSDETLRGWLEPLAAQQGLKIHGDDWQGGLYAWLALRPERVAALRRRDDVLEDERLNPALHLFIETGLACVGGLGFTAPFAYDAQRKDAIDDASRYIRVSVGTTSDADLGLSHDAC
jgi:aspartate/methionine/tyrosine aminotransferase